MNIAEYREYQAAFERFTEGLEAISSGACPGCEACELSEDCSDHDRELAGESFFSWTPCEFCRRPEGGDREPAHAVLDGKIHHFHICVDCVYYLEYGRLDDSTMLELQKEADAKGEILE